MLTKVHEAIRTAALNGGRVVRRWRNEAARVLAAIGRSSGDGGGECRKGEERLERSRHH